MPSTTKGGGSVATLAVNSSTPLEFNVDPTKWERFIAAAEVIGKSPERLIAEAIDLCADTAIAMAAHVRRDDAA